MSQVEIRILGPGDEAMLERFLRPRMASSMFLLGNMRLAGLENRGQRYGGSYAAAFQGGEMVGVLAHFWNGNLICQAESHLEALARAAVEASGEPIRGLIGPAEQVAVLARHLNVAPGQAQMDEEEKLYLLELADLILPELLRSGRALGRRMGAADLDRVAELRVGFALEALGEQESPELWEAIRAGMRRSLDECRSWVLEVAGEVVACSSFNTAIAEMVQVGGVYTPPELRCRGYGRTVVAASLRDARDEGVGGSVLFTGRENLAARRAYEALGYRVVGDYRLLLLREPLSASWI